MDHRTPQDHERLQNQQVIWVASVRPNGRPHLTPVWFIWHNRNFYISIDPKSIKARNLEANPHVVLALEDGSHPIICEGIARPAIRPWQTGVVAVFKQKYDWDINNETQYNRLIEVEPIKWLSW